jgi:hypothetical protein
MSENQIEEQTQPEPKPTPLEIEHVEHDYIEKDASKDLETRDVRSDESK